MGPNWEARLWGRQSLGGGLWNIVAYVSDENDEHGAVSVAFD